MTAINVKSVLFTGLISGIVILISGLSMVPAVGNEMDEILADRGLPPLSNWAILFICFVSICNGIFLVLLYSLLRPLFVSKIRSAFISSLIVFFFTYFLGNVSLVVYGFMPLKFTIIGTAWGLGELLVAGMVASKLYREAKLVN
jgi:hypothetical protein